MDRLPIVLIHGLIGSLDRSVAELASGHDVLAPPMLGYGPHAEIDVSSITLLAQADHFSQVIASRFGDGPVHVLGHSVGGAVAMLLAARHPGQVASVISVEGNFTLRDAFWSASVGRMREDEASELLDGFRADPAAWLARSGIEPTSDNLSTATACLNNQPASTLRAMGQSVLETTGLPAYEATLRTVFASKAVHLIAGERSRDGWDVPDWATHEAASSQTIAGAGHMMMIEHPKAFAHAVANAVGQ